MRRLAILMLLTTACASTPPATQPAAAPAETRPARSGSVPILPRGVSCNSAVVIDGAKGGTAAGEDAWIAENYPGARVLKRSPMTCNDKPADVIEIETANGQKRSVYFAPTTP
jgi:hypothetical protein